MLTFSHALVGTGKSLETASSTVVRVVPEVVDLGAGSVVGEEFTVAVVVENVEELYGFEVWFVWDDEYLEYVEHTRTVAVENFSDPIPPSPYAGILHNPVIHLADTVYTNWYWYAECCIYGADNFTGSGTMFVMTFSVKKQLNTSVATHLVFNRTILADTIAGNIEHEVIEGLVLIPGLSDGYKGDIDEDGDVDIHDIVTMVNAYGTEEGEPDYDPRCDLDIDHRVHISDIVIASGNYGKSI